MDDLIFHKILLASLLETDIKREKHSAYFSFASGSPGYDRRSPTLPLMPSFMLRLSSLKSSQVWVFLSCGEHGET